MSEKMQDLEARIAKRANEEVQNEIARFRSALDTAIKTLLRNCGCSTSSADVSSSYTYPKARKILMTAVGTVADPANAWKNDSGWPAELWRGREDAIRNELFNQMDAMQKVLLARDPKPDDATPEVTTEPTTT
jgi:hypothetical protein